MDEERKRLGHWFGLVLCVFFRKDMWPVKTCATYSKGSFLNKWRKKTKKELADTGSLGKWRSA